MPTKLRNCNIGKLYVLNPVFSIDFNRLHVLFLPYLFHLVKSLFFSLAKSFSSPLPWPYSNPSVP